ncbi:hypothetical protein E4U42_006951 [Claviceps africana]|uniref:Uncharacterized protein n=1 Tax=Claviceps africana TaxID=83212 RepID=A0A8K0J1R1_9HYPO|nr:hypothetical protein E4U42_006951 [Claviceps africana]
MAFTSTPEPSPPPGPTIQACELAALSDAQLDDYLSQIRRAVNLHLEGLDGLSKEQQDALRQRLRTRSQKTSLSVMTLPIDYDRLNARLLEVAAGDTLPRVVRRPVKVGIMYTASGPSFEDRTYYDKQYGHALISLGGRPWCPPSALERTSDDPPSDSENIFTNPSICHRISLTDIEKVYKEAREIEKKLNEMWDFADVWSLYKVQFFRWWDFLEWQRCVRGIPIADGFPQFASVMKRIKETNTHSWPPVTSDELDKEIKKAFDDYDRDDKLGEAKVGGGFPAHVANVKHRLATHGFTRSFQLQEDPQRQDKLTTWIEYISFEYWLQDRLAVIVAREQSQYDAAWKKVVDSKVLDPSETEKDLLSLFRDCDESRSRIKWKLSEARRKVDMLKRGLRSLSDTVGKLSEKLRREAIVDTTSDLMKAKESCRRWEVLLEFFDDTRKSYRKDKLRLERQTVRAQWVLEQLPAVEAELREETEAADPGLSVANGTKKRLGRDEDDASQDGSPKKRRLDVQATSTSEQEITTPPQLRQRSEDDCRKNMSDDIPEVKQVHFNTQGSNSQPEESGGADKLSSDDKTPDSHRSPSKEPSKPSVISPQPLRSPRIASRQDLLETEVPPPQTTKSSHERPRRETALAATASLSAASPNHPSGAPSTTVIGAHDGKRDASETSDSRRVSKRRRVSIDQ